MMPEIQQRQAQFEELHRQFYPAVYQFLYRLVGSSEDARDIVQETFLRLYRNNSPVLQNPRGWIYRVAANLGRDHLRRKNVRWRITAADPPPQNQDGSAEEELIRSDEINAVRKALGRLARRDQILLMLYQDGLTYVEMAEAAGVARASLGKTLARAIARLGRQLREMGIRPDTNGKEE